MYNVEKWIKTCIKSIQNQEYDDFQCVIIDDMSTDSTTEIVKNLISGDDRFNLILNKEKKFALKNIYEGIKLLNPSDEDIIITIDGDDWLYDSTVFDKVKNTYEQKQCWLTYGNYVTYPHGKYSNLSDYEQDIIEKNSYRQNSWRATHLRTFKFKLWKNIKKEDLIDNKGEFYRMAWDLAFMFPMLEMSGGKFTNIKEPLYVYNIANPLNDNKVDVNLQLETDKQIRQKIRYNFIGEE